MLEVVRVVKGLLSLVANGEDGLDRLHRIFPAQRFRSKQDAVHAVQDSIGHICRLCPAQLLNCERVTCLES